MSCNKKLTAEIIKDIGIIHRFDTPQTYEIGKTGVTVDIQYQALPSVITDENGVVYAFISGRVYHVDPFGHTLMYKSYDNGKTWSDPIIVNDVPTDDRDVGAVYLGNGKMLISCFRIAAWGLMGEDQEITTADGITIKGIRPATRDENGEYVNGWFNWQSNAFSTKEQRDAVFAYWNTATKEDLEGGCWCLISEDYGKTWSKPKPAPVYAPHGPILRKDGSLLYVGRGSVEGVGGDGIYAFTSNDCGDSWQLLAKLYERAMMVYSDPHVAELPNGRLVAAIRVDGAMTTVDGVSYKYVGYDSDGQALFANGENTVTIDEDYKINSYDGEGKSLKDLTSSRTYICISDDGGKTWTPPSLMVAQDHAGLEVTKGCPYGTAPHLMVFDDDKIVMTYSTKSREVGQRAIISYDFGETWDKEIVLCNKPYDADPDQTNKYKLGDVGNTATVKTADGNLLSVYYQAYTGDLYCSFLYTKWSLK